MKYEVQSIEEMRIVRYRTYVVESTSPVEAEEALKSDGQLRLASLKHSTPMMTPEWAWVETIYVVPNECEGEQEQPTP